MLKSECDFMRHQHENKDNNKNQTKQLTTNNKTQKHNIAKTATQNRKPQTNPPKHTNRDDGNEDDQKTMLPNESKRTMAEAASG